MSTTIKLHEATKQFKIANKFAMFFLEKIKLPVKSHSSVITVDQLESLREFLLRERPFVLGLLQNPNLLEHEAFTDLLWALTHLTEELVARPGFAGLPATDLAHLGNDLSRAFGLLIREWLAYLLHLRDTYPYIYSLALRTNPFDPAASPIVSPAVGQPSCL